MAGIGSGGEDDRDIFDAGNASPAEVTPDDLSITAPPAPEDRAVSEAINALSRGPAPQAATRTPAAPPAVPTADNGLPEEERSNSGMLRAMLDERERRQELTRQIERYQRLEQEQKQREEAARTPLSQRLFEQPEEALAELRDQITKPLTEQIQQMRIQHDFALAGVRHADKFADAWSAWYQRVGGGQDPQTYFAVMNSPSPGEALVQWFKEQQFRDRIGNDPDAYDRSVIERYLAGEISIDSAATQAGPASTRPRDESGRFTANSPPPQAPQRLPTATSRLGPSGMGHSDRDEDGSDDAIFASGRPSRRGDR
jgi:hypothetical protein